MARRQALTRPCAAIVLLFVNARLLAYCTDHAVFAAAEVAPATLLSGRMTVVFFKPAHSILLLPRAGNAYCPCSAAPQNSLLQRIQNRAGEPVAALECYRPAQSLLCAVRYCLLPGRAKTKNVIANRVGETGAVAVKSCGRVGRFDSTGAVNVRIKPRISVSICATCRVLWRNKTGTQDVCRT